MYNFFMYKKMGWLIICALLLSSLFVGCTNGATYRTEGYLSMGTAVQIYLFADEATFSSAMEITEEVLNYADALHGEDGCITRFNEASFGETVELDKVVFDVLNAAKTEEILDGYNPLMAPLVDLWGFSPRFVNGEYEEAFDRKENPDGSIPLPDDKYIAAFLSLTDLNGLLLTERGDKFYCTKNIPSVIVDGVEYSAKLDVSGSIKGYCADLIASRCKDMGIKYGYVSFGRSSITLLDYKDGTKNWKVTLTDPNDTADTYYSFNIPNGSVSTSGDYEKYYITDGKRYCHIIGKDGYPVTNARAVTVIGGSSLYCDMLSTALMTAPIEELDERVSAVKALGYDVVYCHGEELNVSSTVSGEKDV